MKARYPYRNNTGDIQEFDAALGDIVHFAAFYEYLFAVVSVNVRTMHTQDVVMGYKFTRRIHKIYTNRFLG